MNENKLITFKLTERQHQALMLLRMKLPELNLSHFIRKSLAVECRAHGIDFPDDMPAVGSQRFLIQQAEDLENLMDIQSKFRVGTERDGSWYVYSRHHFGDVMERGPFETRRVALQTMAGLEGVSFEEDDR